MSNYDAAKARRLYYAAFLMCDETLTLCEVPECETRISAKIMELHHIWPRSVLKEEDWYDTDYMRLICPDCHKKIHKFERIAYAKSKSSRRKS